MLRALWISLTAALGAGCATIPYDRPMVAKPGNTAPRVQPDDINEEVIEYVDRVAEESARMHANAVPVSATTTPASFRKRAVATQEPANEISETLAHIPVEINGAVKKWIEYFTVKARDRFTRYLERGETYRPMIQEVLRDQGLPADLYYLALIESGFATHATSRASAVGIWQFIAPTGKRYGLRVDSYVDERRDPMRATVAASIYLKDLHNVFQSWYLAMAAYNAGESRIMNAIMNGKSRNFWELVKARRLPAETMNYIPKFLAAVIIGHNPEHYGFNNISGEAMPDLVMVKVPAPVKLNDISRITGISYKSLKAYNPQIRRGMTPPSTKTYGIWVPKGTQHLVADNRSDLERARVRASRSSSSFARGKYRYHRVRSGENLSLIARKYKVSVAKLRRMNGMKSNTLYAGTNIRVGEASGEESVSANLQKYRVKHGDNLHKIAKQFNVPIHELKEINRLKRNTIYVGQILRINDRG